MCKPVGFGIRGLGLNQNYRSPSIKFTYTILVVPYYISSIMSPKTLL